MAFQNAFEEAVNIIQEVRITSFTAVHMCMCVCMHVCVFPLCLSAFVKPCRSPWLQRLDVTLLLLLLVVVFDRRATARVELLWTIA